MGVMHIVWSVIVGFVAGLVARAITPGADHMGFIATSVLGIRTMNLSISAPSELLSRSSLNSLIIQFS